jgi:hypothetical protein
MTFPLTCSPVNLDFQNLHHEGRMNIFKMPSRGLFRLFGAYSLIGDTLTGKGLIAALLEEKRRKY